MFSYFWDFPYIHPCCFLSQNQTTHSLKQSHERSSFLNHGALDTPTCWMFFFFKNASKLWRDITRSRSQLVCNLCNSSNWKIRKTSVLCFRGFLLTYLSFPLHVGVRQESLRFNTCKCKSLFKLCRVPLLCQGKESLATTLPKVAGRRDSLSSLVPWQLLECCFHFSHFFLRMFVLETENQKVMLLLEGTSQAKQRVRLRYSWTIRMPDT